MKSDRVLSSHMVSEEGTHADCCHSLNCVVFTQQVISLVMVNSIQHCSEHRIMCPAIIYL